MVAKQYVCTALLYHGSVTSTPPMIAVVLLLEGLRRHSIQAAHVDN